MLLADQGMISTPIPYRAGALISAFARFTGKPSNHDNGASLSFRDMPASISGGGASDLHERACGMLVASFLSLTAKS